MDYRHLLKQYIRHLRAVEGSDFIGAHYWSLSPLTEEELHELEKLATEIDAESK